MNSFIFLSFFSNYNLHFQFLNILSLLHFHLPFLISIPIHLLKFLVCIVSDLASPVIVFVVVIVFRVVVIRVGT